MRWKPSIVFLGGALILSLPGVANGDAPRRAPARCTDEVPLAIMAGELLLDGDMPTDAELLRNLREAGSDLPVVHALRTKPEDEGRRQSWLDGLRERHEASLVCGKASSPSETLWLVAPRGGELTVHGNRVRAEIRPPFMKPRLVLRDAKGTVRTMPVKGGEEIDLPTDLDPPLTVQLMADGPRGPRPVAELHPRSELESAPMASTSMGASSDADVRGASLARITTLRRGEGAADLRRNVLLARVAKKHAEEVCRSGRVAHNLAEGNPEERLAREGIKARGVGEVVGRGRSVAEVMGALEGSPSHWMTMVEPRFTDVGIGEARDSAHRICLVALFAAWPQAAPR